MRTGNISVIKIIQLTFAQGLRIDNLKEPTRQYQQAKYPNNGQVMVTSNWESGASVCLVHVGHLTYEINMSVVFMGKDSRQYPSISKKLTMSLTVELLTEMT
jgi:hypothetical protein